MRNVSLTEENETALVHEGALPPLIELLQHTDEHIAEQALVTLRNMSVNVDNEVTMALARVLLPSLPPEKDTEAQRDRLCLSVFLFLSLSVSSPSSSLPLTHARTHPRRSRWCSRAC